MVQKARATPDDVLSRDPEVHGGDLVFAGTRVPVDSLVDALKAGQTIDDFLEGYPSVARWQVEAFLELPTRTLGIRGAEGGVARGSDSVPGLEYGGSS
jgi:uncharacterized protein (DUF433 family)